MLAVGTAVYPLRVDRAMSPSSKTPLANPTQVPMRRLLAEPCGCVCVNELLTAFAPKVLTQVASRRGDCIKGRFASARSPLIASVSVCVR